MDNALLNMDGYFPVDKIDERINSALRPARLYLSGSDYERDNKSNATKTFDISCDGGVSISSLSVITLSVSATLYEVCC